MGNIKKEIIRLKDFDSLHLQKVQNDIIKTTINKTDELLEEYKNFTQSHHGTYINSDLMKMVFDIYAESPHNRSLYNLAVTNSAACLTNELYTRTIRNSSIKRCIYVVGPYGAGKSFFAQSLFLMDMIPDDTMVYEGSITAPSFGEKVKLAIKNNITPEVIVLNPTLELSMRNIKQRAIETGRDVIKSEIVDKYANIYPNMLKLFEQANTDISFQIYNKSSNIPEDSSISYDLNDLKHGTIQEISEQYDSIMKKIFMKSLEDLKDDEQQL